jgi:hypothetical protein
VRRFGVFVVVSLLLAPALAACGDDVGAPADETETGSEAARQLIIEPDFGPLCVGAGIQSPLGSQLDEKLLLELAPASLSIPSALPWPSPRTDWDEVALTLAGSGREGALAAGESNLWGLFEDQGAEIYYNQEPFAGLDLLVLALTVTDPAAPGTVSTLEIRVAAPAGEDFVLGSDPALRELRSLTLWREIEGGSTDKSPIEACDAELDEIPISVEFERGAFEAQIAVFGSYDLLGSGFLRDVHGTLDGVEFAQDDPLELSYASIDLYNETVSSIFRFPEPIGEVCGITLEYLSYGASLDQPNLDWPMTAAHTIDCALAPIDALSLTHVAYGL